MSNIQQEKLLTPVLKIASHARLQKEEDEESWISSEDLRTDGSSDEECKPKNKMLKVKHSKKTRTAQLMKNEKKIEKENEDELKEFQLPPIHLQEEIRKENAEESASATSFDYFNKACCTSKYYTKRKSLEESIRKSHEIDKLWRPKRGSITLPIGPDGEEKSIHLITLEMNEFYIDMLEKLKYLREERRGKNENRTWDNDDNESIISAESEAKLQKDPNAALEFNKIKELDQKLFGLKATLKDVTEERIELQTKMCNLIKNDGRINKNAENFLKLCKFEDVDEEVAKNVNEAVPPPDVKCEKVKKNNQNAEKDFITRNIKLAKERNAMASLCLTDEEKLKLSELLADLDSNEYCIKELIKQRKDNEKLGIQTTQKNDDPKQYGDVEIEQNKENEVTNEYKFNSEDEAKLLELEKKLTALLEPDLGTSNGKKVDDLKTTDEEGKYWKHQLLKDRLNEIDNELFTLQKEKLQEIKQKISGEGDDEDNDEDESDEDSEETDDSEEDEDEEEDDQESEESDEEQFKKEEN